MFSDNKILASLCMYKDNRGQNGSIVRFMVGRTKEIPGHEFKGVIFFRKGRFKTEKGQNALKMDKR